MDKRRVVIGLVILALLGTGVVFAVTRGGDNSNETNADNSQDISEESDDTPSDVSTDPIENGEDQNDQDNTPPVKQPAPALSIDAEPVVFTGYGHNAQKPLKTGANTSTTCTTDANVNCVVTLTNTASGQVVSFDPQKTDAQGVTRWEWTGGEDVGSGTWNVVATAGDKSSAAEVIYVQ